MLASGTQMPSDGDTVVLHFNHTDMRAIKLARGEKFQCKTGIFTHNDVLATPFGARVQGRSASRNDRFTPQAVVLRLTPELWTRCLRHRTQIIFMTDIAVIIQHLRLRPGCVVAEAGTGSGSLTHSLARAVAPHGRVFTFDFHKSRAEEARKEFADHGIGDVVVSGWRDVCRPGAGVLVPQVLTSVDPLMTAPASEDDDKGEPVEAAAAPSGDAKPADEEPQAGYGLEAGTVDAVFLDVPSPWLAVPNVMHVLKEGGAVCSYSPCIEQSLKFCTALRRSDDFLDMHTVEALTREYAPVFPQIAAGVDGRRGRDDGDGDAGAEEGEPVLRAARGEGVQFQPRPDGKGHSAYLTFARKRIRAPPSS